MAGEPFGAAALFGVEEVAGLGAGGPAAPSGGDEGVGDAVAEEAVVAGEVARGDEERASISGRGAGALAAVGLVGVGRGQEELR
ncbi:hypothetical protein WEB32_30430 [Streptomyces netropsis]|uniref:hypothetical protein n=1 Tax=Streptomyces netropsis TaxID=55404 RepID=UPI0030CC1488